MVEHCKCVRCGHEWTRKGYVTPDNDRCPNHSCRTPNWRTGVNRPKNGGIGPAVIIDGRKRCSCKDHDGERMVPISKFTVDKHNKSGYNAQCNVCATRRRHTRWDKHPRRLWAVNTLGNHRFRGYSVTLSFDVLETLANEHDVCDLCGIELDWAHKQKVLPNSPTLDRVDNADEIEKNNIMIVCHQCNRTKGERTMKEFVKYCSMVATRLGDMK